MASYPGVVVAVLLLLLFIQSASGWRSYCKLNPNPIVPAPVDCSKLLLTWIDKCFCDRDVTMFQECAHRVRDELDPERATPAIVYEISVIVERFSAVGPLDTETQQTLWQLYDKLLLVRQPVFVRSNDDQWSSTQRLLTSLDRMMRGADMEAATYMKGTNLAMLKQPREKCEQNAKFGQGIADYGSHFGPLGEEGGGISPLASIEVPADVACKSGEAEEESDEDAAAIFFVLYRKAHLFLGNSTHPSNARFGRELDGGDRSQRCKPGLFADKDRTVLSATVVDGGQQRNISSSNNGTKTMAKLSYRKQPFPALHGQYLVTWWEVDQSWWAEDDACRLVHRGDLLEAECPHLTDFTLLVNGLETDPSLCDGFLNVLGYTLNLGSFLALLVLNALYLVYKRPALYDRVFVQLLANRLPRMKLDSEAVFYNVSLMLFYFSFAVFSDEKHTGSGGVFCRMVAIFNYWLLMACILQTIFQAWRILKMFLWTVALERAVIVATKRRYVLGISFGLPTLLCLLFGLLTDNFFYRNDEFCWIRPSYVWFAVVLPLSLLLLNAVVCSAVICFRLFPNSCGMERVWQKHASSTIRLAKGVRKQSQQKLTVLLLMQFSLGMPWILQFATLAIPHVSVFHFLFTLVNGSQGMMLLSLFGFKQVQAWRSVRASQKRPTTEEEPNKVPDSPKVENGDVFTNSIGMRIPVAQSTKTEGKQQKKEKEQQKSKRVAGEKH